MFSDIYLWQTLLICVTAALPERPLHSHHCNIMQVDLKSAALYNNDNWKCTNDTDFPKKRTGSKGALTLTKSKTLFLWSQGNFTTWVCNNIEKSLFCCIENFYKRAQHNKALMYTAYTWAWEMSFWAKSGTNLSQFTPHCFTKRFAISWDILK